MIGVVHNKLAILIHDGEPDVVIDAFGIGDLGRVGEERILGDLDAFAGFDLLGQVQVGATIVGGAQHVFSGLSDIELAIKSVVMFAAIFDMLVLGAGNFRGQLRLLLLSYLNKNGSSAVDDHGVIDVCSQLPEVGEAGRLHNRIVMALGDDLDIVLAIQRQLTH